MARLTWGDFLHAAMKHGVTLDSIEDPELTEEGERQHHKVIVRRMPNGSLRYQSFGDRALSDPIDWLDARRLINVFALPYKEFERFCEDRTPKWPPPDRGS